MTTNEKQIEAIKQVIMKYMVPDCFRPEYNGMTALEISRIILGEIERVKEEEDIWRWAELHGARQNEEGEWIV